MTIAERAGDISPDEFRRAAHAAVDWIADYLEHPERQPVRPNVRPGDIASQLPTSAPVHAESLDDIVKDFHDIIMPGITHWNSPTFFGYFSISGSYPGILGELFAAGLNVNNMLWLTSPAATELELRTVDWLRQLMGLGDGWFGEITDTASISTLYALAAAREAAGLDVRTRGMAGRADMPALRVYTSSHAHSSVEKAVITLGLGHENVVKIPVDSAYRMRPELLREAIQRDVDAGLRPLAMVATVGTTSTSSIDSVREIVPIAREFGCWVHVDAAYGGPAAIVPELRWLLDGVDAETLGGHAAEQMRSVTTNVRDQLAYLRGERRGEEAKLESERDLGKLCAIEYQENDLLDEKLLGYLAEEQFLPRYGFPVHVVPLQHAWEKERNVAGKFVREDDDGKLRLQRDVALALNEYAPGAEVVAAQHVGGHPGGGRHDLIYRRPR